MITRACFRRSRWVALVAVVCATAAGNALPRCTAADPLKESTSLKFAPHNASFYSASFRMKEQFDAFLKSNAYAKLKTLPFYQMARAWVQGQLASPAVAVELAKPENQELLKLAGEMFSQEVFIFGDERFAQLAELYAMMNTANQLASFEAVLVGGPGAPADPRQMILALQKNRAMLKTPNLVVGFKIKSRRKARNQIARLQKILEAQLAVRPEWKKRLRNTKVSGRDFLTLSLDGSMIDWGDAPFKPFEKEDGEFQELIDHLKNLKLTLALGLRGDYLLLGVGETTAHLKALGTGKLLYDRPELAPLRKHAGKPITSVSYTSKRYGGPSRNATAQLEQMLRVAKQAYGKAKVDEKVKREFGADVDKILKAVEDRKAESGARMSYTFRTSRGYEGFAYNWGQGNSLDGSKRLTLLDHVGASPIAFVVSRRKYDPESYQLFARIVERAFYYGEKALLGYANEKERAQYLKFRKILLPLVARLHKANEEQLIPALKDGQSALVLDAKIKSRQWFLQMPRSEKPLPMLELGLVLGVSDAEKLKKGCSEYVAVARKLLDAVREAAPDVLPPFKFPQAIVKKTGEATTYRYPQLQELGVDKQLAPSAGLTKRVAVLSTSPGLVQRVLKRRPASLVPGLLSDRSRALAAASYLNWPALVDAVTPWVDYGFAQYAKAAGNPMTEADTNAILDQVHTGLTILKCFRGSSAATYREGNAMVTHTESVLRDLKK